GNAQAIVDARQVANRHVNATARLGNALDFTDHRLAVEIFQLDFKLGPAARVSDAGVASDKTLGLEHLKHAFALLGSGHRNLRLVAHLCVSDARDHVTDRIVHCHRALLTSSTSQAPG